MSFDQEIYDSLSTNDYYDNDYECDSLAIIIALLTNIADSLPNRNNIILTTSLLTLPMGGVIGYGLKSYFTEPLVSNKDSDEPFLEV